MTLDEAIKHAEKVMVENLEKTKGRNASDPIAINCFECAEEQKQLAEWLRDYKRLLEQEPCEDVIRREDAINTISEALEHVFVENEDVARKMMNKLPSVKPQESCKDAINRAKVLEAIRKLPHAGWLVSTESVLNVLSELPPVTPQPKTGHWIDEGIYADGQNYHAFMCSECEWHYIGNKSELVDFKYCPFCRAKMQEAAEGSDKE